jgi:hypothetical protein
MWIIRAYDKQTDELQREVHLPGRLKPQIFRRHGFVHVNRYVSTPVPATAAYRIAHASGSTLPVKPGWDYVLDYDQGKPKRPRSGAYKGGADAKHSPKLRRAI